MNTEMHQATIPAVSADGKTHLVVISRTPEGRISIIAHVCLCVLTYDRHQLLLAIRTLAEENGKAESGKAVEGKAESGKAEIGKLRTALERINDDRSADWNDAHDLRTDVCQFATAVVEAIERLEARTAQPPN